MDLTFIKCADLKKLDVRHYFKYIILQIFLLERTFQNSSILVVLIMVLKTGPGREPEKGVVPVSLVGPGSDW